MIDKNNLLIKQIKRIHITVFFPLVAPIILLICLGCQIVDISPNQSDLGDTDKKHGGSGGRINGLALSSNAQIAYAASEWGGLFKSLD